MPYILQEQRNELDDNLTRLVGSLLYSIPEEKRIGACNYVITSILLRSLNPKNYSDMNKLIGVLECAKLELYRRKVGPYEDKAIEKNGDLEEFC